MAAMIRAWRHWLGLPMEQEGLSLSLPPFPVGLTTAPAGTDSLSDGR